MTLPSDPKDRFPVAPELVQFVALGFGDHDLSEAPAFRCLRFMTDDLTSWQAEAAVAAVPKYRSLRGDAVARAIVPFRRRVRGWRFGRHDKPLLVALLPRFLDQIEILSVDNPTTPVSAETRRKLVAALIEAFPMAEPTLDDPADPGSVTFRWS